MGIAVLTSQSRGWRKLWKQDHNASHGPRLVYHQKTQWDLRLSNFIFMYFYSNLQPHIYPPYYSCILLDTAVCFLKVTYGFYQ